MKPLCADDVMTRKVKSVRENTKIKDIIRLIRGRKFSGFPVVNAHGRAVGLISQNDVLRSLAHVLGPDAGELADGEPKRGETMVRLRAALKRTDALAPARMHQLLDRPVREIMTTAVFGCLPDTPLKSVCGTMVANRIHRVIVLDRNEKVVGLISALDLVRCFADQLGAGGPRA